MQTINNNNNNNTKKKKKIIVPSEQILVFCANRDMASGYHV
jgi:hypothetical protein